MDKIQCTRPLFRLAWGAGYREGRGRVDKGSQQKLHERGRKTEAVCGSSNLSNVLTRAEVHSINNRA